MTMNEPQPIVEKAQDQSVGSSVWKFKALVLEWTVESCCGPIHWACMVQQFRIFPRAEEGASVGKISEGKAT